MLVLTFVLVIGVLLTASNVVLAQVSQSYNMLCWGTIADGGGVRESSQYLLLDSFGQQFAGASDSPSYRLRAGYVQERPGSQPPPPPAKNPLYLPIVQTAGALGVCSW